MRSTSLVLGVVLGLVLSLSAGAAAPAVPKAVQRAIDTIFGGAETKVEHEREGGKDVYEVEAPARLEVVLDGSGGVTEVEVKIPVGLVPPAVLGAARGALPRDARIVETELLVRGRQHFYEVEARTGAGAVEIILDAGGAIVEQHVEQDGDADSDD